MTLQRCPMAPLVEARQDGRLSARDAASLERHLATCALCAELAADLSRIAELLRAPLPSASPLEHRRDRVRLLREAALPPARARAARARPGLLLASAAALVALLIWTVMRPSDTPPLAQVPAPAQPSAARQVTTVQPDAGTRFTRTAAEGIETVTLEDGGVTFWVHPLQMNERFIVKTADAEVEVRGTVFRVEAIENRIRVVSVTEGKVEVRFRALTESVGAGQVWRPASDGPMEQRPDAPNAADPAPSPAPAPRAPVATAAPRRAPVSREVSTAPPSPLDAGAVSPTNAASKEFAEGVRLIERGDYGAAADRLEGFAAAHPQDESAEDAAFLAIVSLQRAGRQTAAALAARRYLTRYPHGYRRAEVEALAASISDGGASSP